MYSKRWEDGRGRGGETPVIIIGSSGEGGGGLASALAKLGEAGQQNRTNKKSRRKIIDC